MSTCRTEQDAAFLDQLADRLTELRLQVDAGELTTRAAFRAALERDGRFTVSDPRVRRACWTAGLGGWLSGP